MNEPSHFQVPHIRPRPKHALIVYIFFALALLPSVARGQLYDPAGGPDLAAAS